MSVAVLVAACVAAYLSARVLFALRKVDRLNSERVNRLARIMRKELKVTAQETVDAIVAQLGKAKTEIVTKIAELEAANPGVDLSALTEIAQGLDDVVPEVVPAEPVADTPPEYQPLTEKRPHTPVWGRSSSLVRPDARNLAVLIHRQCQRLIVCRCCDDQPHQQPRPARQQRQDEMHGHRVALPVHQTCCGG